MAALLGESAARPSRFPPWQEARRGAPRQDRVSWRHDRNGRKQGPRCPLADGGPGAGAPFRSGDDGLRLRLHGGDRVLLLRLAVRAARHRPVPVRAGAQRQPVRHGGRHVRRFAQARGAACRGRRLGRRSVCGGPGVRRACVLRRKGRRSPGKPGAVRLCGRRGGRLRGRGAGAALVRPGRAAGARQVRLRFGPRVACRRAGGARHRPSACRPPGRFVRRAAGRVHGAPARAGRAPAYGGAGQGAARRPCRRALAARIRERPCGRQGACLCGWAAPRQAAASGARARRPARVRASAVVFLWHARLRGHGQPCRDGSRFGPCLAGGRAFRHRGVPSVRAAGRQALCGAAQRRPSPP